MQKISDYTILEELAHTKRSLVYRGRKDNESKTVIIKVLNARYSSPSEIARFKQEYNLIRSIDDEGVIKTFDIFSQNGNFAIILEDFGGIPIKSVLEKEKFDTRSFLEIAVRLAETLGHIHQKDIVHKDIRTQNILINRKTGQVKITDFGISSVLTHKNDEIYDPEVIEGTLTYMSPEQTGRMNRPVDYRTDLYSLGITFYEMLTGTVPFRSDNPMEIIHSHIAVNPIPPSIRNPEIPEVISDMIMKLLLKNAEDRYQNAFGLMADLKKCLRQLKGKRKIKSFKLAQKDISRKFNIPQKLYGREKEIEDLISALERVTGGVSECMLVTGRPGIGKTALVNEIHKPVVAKRGYFLSGKYEQLRKDEPYSSIIQAFQGMVRQILSESEEKIKAWKEEISAALEPNGRIITDIIPEVKLIIGEQPDVPELGPEESRNRFNLVFEKFISVFPKEEHPVALFLDDLQWVDMASLRLINNIITNPGIKYLFLIGAYQDNEVPDTHPLADTLKELEKANIRVNNITLGPLTGNDINDLIMDFLKCSEEKGAELAELVFKKAGGNPFFIIQFLETLHHEKLIELDATAGWQWDMGRLNRLQVTDNLVELLTGKINRLTGTTQEVLKIAACIGNRFDLVTLAYMLNESVDEALSDIAEALDEGLIYESGDRYFYHHDRIRDAAYSLLTKEEKAELRYKIGKLELEQADEGALQEKLFYVVDQLNLGSELITGKKEREELSGLNLEAGKKAKDSAAYSQSLRYLETGMGLLERECWETQYDLALAIYTESTETAYLNGDYERMNGLAEVVIKRAKTVIDKVRIFDTRIKACEAQQDIHGAVCIGLDALKSLGVKIPQEPGKLSVLQGLVKVKSALSGKKIEDLIDLPEMTDPKMLAATQLLGSLGYAAYLYDNQNLYPVIALNNAYLTIRHGIHPAAAYTFSGYAIILIAGLGDIENGYKAGNLALKLLERKTNARGYTDRVHLMYNTLTRHWKEHLKKTIAPLREAYQTGLETGDVEFAANNLFLADAHSLFCSGKGLTELEQDMAKHAQLIDQLNQAHILQQHIIFWQWVLNLLGENDDPTHLIGKAFDEEKAVPLFIKTKYGSALAGFYYIRSALRYLFQRYSQALEDLRQAEKYINNLQGTIFISLFYFYDSLTRLALYPDVIKGQRKKYLKRVAENQKKLKKWAEYAPMNHLHKFHLVEAERARVLGDNDLAEKSYGLAIELSKKHEYLFEEALANELAAKFYLSREKEKAARIYMAEAYNCYSRWGVAAKLKHLKKRYPELLTNVVSFEGTPGRVKEATDQIDIKTFKKALSAIAGEKIHSKMIEKIIRVAIEFACAQKGLLILKKGAEGAGDKKDNFLIEAEGSVDTDEVTIFQSIPIESSTNLSQTVVNYVKMTKESVVIHDANEPQKKFPQLHTDPYIKDNQVKSILCMPITVGLDDGVELTGILYLENNRAAKTFTEERIETLDVICLSAAGRIELSRRAITDSLTGLYNHDYFQNILQQEILLSERYGHEVSVMMIDIDHFKKVNDTWGHQVGDLTLRSIAGRIKDICRKSDIVCRYGGEEISIILPETGPEGAATLAKRLIEGVRDMSIGHRPKADPLKITISVGVAGYPANATDKNALIKKADDALYQSKANGRNQATLAG